MASRALPRAGERGQRAAAVLSDGRAACVWSPAHAGGAAPALLTARARAGRVMLADRLLAKADYDCSREVRTLELLKLRFGDVNLHTCEARRPPSPSPAAADSCPVGLHRGRPARVWAGGCALEPAGACALRRVEPGPPRSAPGPALCVARAIWNPPCNPEPLDLRAACAGDAEGHGGQQAAERGHLRAAGGGDVAGAARPPRGRRAGRPLRDHPVRPLLAARPGSRPRPPS